MKIRKTRLAALLGVLCLSFNSLALAADDSTAASKAEASKRFERALTLFNEGDNAGALAEFKQTYLVMPNPVVLYNIGLVYAAMGRPVESVDALTTVLAQGGLSTDQLDRAKQTLADQQARIGRLSVNTVPEGAHVEIDNVEVATTPLKAPLRVAEGNHVVGVVAEGYTPTRREVVIAGNAEATVSFEMVRAIARRPANLTVHSRLIGAEVLIDGKSAGKTPLQSSLNVPAGKHSVELKRPGYSSAKQDVDLGEGATGELTLNPTMDEQALSSESALLTLDLHGRPAELTVDDDRLGPYKGSVRLPKGPHRIRIESSGFLPSEQTVTVGAVEGQITTVWLEPTPETRAAHDSNVRFHRVFGWIGVGAGAAILGGSAVYLGVRKNHVDSSAIKTAQAAYDSASAAQADGNTPPFCNYKGGAMGPGIVVNSTDDCNAYVKGKTDTLNLELSNARNKDTTEKTIGYVGLGVGGALLTTGIILLVTGESSHAYDKPTAGGDKGARWALTPGPGQYGLGLNAAF